MRLVNEPPIRGRILDDKGRPLVDNRIANVITIDRNISTANRTMVVNRLAELLQVPAAELRKKLDDPRVSPYTPVPVASDVPYSVLAYVSEHREDFPGVRAEPLAVRNYVDGSLAAHVLGYIGEINAAELKAQPKSAHYELGDDIGKSGVELTYESDLRGTAGTDRVEVDSTGRVLRTLSSTKPKPGHDVELTIDMDTQKLRGGLTRPGHHVGPGDPGQEHQDGVREAQRPAGAVVVAECAGRLGGGDGLQPDVQPERLRERDLDADVELPERPRRATTRWSIGRLPASTNPVPRSSS